MGIPTIITVIVYTFIILTIGYAIGYLYGKKTGELKSIKNQKTTN